jgi:hypothetical protein
MQKQGWCTEQGIEGQVSVAKEGREEGRMPTKDANEGPTKEARKEAKVGRKEAKEEGRKEG